MTTTPAPVGSLVLLDDNLLSSSGLVVALKRLGYTVTLLSDARDATTRAAAVAPRAILLNLGARAWDANALITDLKAALPTVPLIGFAGHKEVERITAARAAGCDHVVANSTITSDPASVLRHALRT